jgi:hypothetical protein
MRFKVRLDSMQRLIVFSTIFLVLSWRAMRYLFSKNISVIMDNGNYFDINSIFAIMFFIVCTVLFFVSIIGFVKIIRRIYVANKDMVVRERFFNFVLNCFVTFLVSFFVAIILKVIIWP